LRTTSRPLRLGKTLRQEEEQHFSKLKRHQEYFRSESEMTILWYKERLLSNSQIMKLQKHKYATDSDSIVDPYMQPWWNFVVSLMPMWLAPNLITISGLAVNLLAAFMLIFSCPTATEEVPGWIPLSVCLGMFIYQTLDAIDGKQARRTGSSNALGELFDHGCDSISNLVLSVAGACAMSMGYLNPYWMLSYCFLGTFLFYIAHWQAYVTGRMRFGHIDATEAQFTMMALMLLTGIFGTEFWGIQIFGFVSLRFFPLVLGTALAFLSLPATVNRVLFGGAGRNGATVAGSSVLCPALPLLLVLVPAYYIASNSDANILENHSVLFIMTFGMMASKATNKLIVAQMTKSELDSYDSVFLWCLAMGFNQSKGPFVSEYNLLVFVCIFVVIDYVLYCTRVIKDICDSTGWPLFQIDVRASNEPAAAAAKNGSRTAAAAKTS